MSLKYAHEKFHTAVLTLAGHGSIQERGDAANLLI